MKKFDIRITSFTRPTATNPMAISLVKNSISLIDKFVLLNKTRNIRRTNTQTSKKDHYILLSHTKCNTTKKQSKKFFNSNKQHFNVIDIVSKPRAFSRVEKPVRGYSVLDANRLAGLRRKLTVKDLDGISMKNH